MNNLSLHKKDCWAELRKLISIVKELSLTKDLSSISSIALHYARSLTNADGATFVLKEQESCYFLDEAFVNPLWRRKKIPMKDCVCGVAIENGEPIRIKNLYADPRVHQDTYKGTEVKSVLVVPILPSKPIGAIASYWIREYSPSYDELNLLQALADISAICIERVKLYSEMEDLVKERTAQLENEIADRKKAEKIIRQQSLTDSLTGLLNRRGFFFQVEQELKIARRLNHHSVLMFADVDGLKKVNDSFGHLVGDQMIVSAANVLGKVFRSSDVIARLGGDEFVAFTMESTSLETIRNRIQTAIEDFNSQKSAPYSLSLSIGLVPMELSHSYSLKQWIDKADAEMYREKHNKHTSLMSC